MPNYVALDDKITRVTPDYTVCETVESVTREGFATKSAPGLTSLRHTGEGITWVRGWLLPDSEDVKAARVAQGLEENKEQTTPHKSFEELMKEMMLQGMVTNPALPPPPQPAPYPGIPSGTTPWISVPMTTDGVSPLIGDPVPNGFPGGKTTC